MPNEKIRQQNIEKVLNQARKLFIANGIENTTMEMIARESEITLRSVQNYFHSKDDLHLAVFNKGCSLELDEIRAFFKSEQYLGKNGAEQIIDIISETLNKAVEHAETVLFTVQLQRIISRASGGGKELQLADNWAYMMEHIQMAFDKGVLDGSISKATSEELADVKTIMLGLLGIREQIACAMCDSTMCRLFEPEATVRKYIRQMERIIKAK